MPKVMKTCRVCGKLYEACRTVNKTPGVFRWQEVACSPECGEVYLRKVTEARMGKQDTANAEDKREAPVAKAPVVEAPVAEASAEAAPAQARADRARAKATRHK